MDIQGHNHLPPEELHIHDHSKPRWLPFALGLLVILVAALALLNRERIVAFATPATTGTTDQTSSAPATTTTPAPATKPAVKPVTKPKGSVATKPVATTASITGLHLSALATSNGTNLTWTASSDANVTGYKIVRSATNANLAYPADGYVRFNVGRTNTQYLDTGAQPGRSYYYRICSVTADNKVSCGNVVQTIGD